MSIFLSSVDVHLIPILKSVQLSLLKVSNSHSSYSAAYPFHVHNAKCSHDRPEVQPFAGDDREHIHPPDQDRATGNWYLARRALRDHQSNLVDHVDAGRADLSVPPYAVAFTFGGFVTANGWPERDAVVQFVVCQVDCFLDETTVRRYHSELTLRIPTSRASRMSIW